MDQSHHMIQLFMHGAGRIDHLAPISPNTPRQLSAGTRQTDGSVNHDGELMRGDILFFRSTAEDGRVLVGHHILIDWARFQIEEVHDTGKDLRYLSDQNSTTQDDDPTFYRHELQGLDAKDVMQVAIDVSAPN